MQSLFKHTFTSVEFPLHSFPPYCGGVQVLCLEWIPLPHVTEQSLQSDQADHVPSTNGNTAALMTVFLYTGRLTWTVLGVTLLHFFTACAFTRITTMSGWYTFSYSSSTSPATTNTTSSPVAPRCPVTINCKRDNAVKNPHSDITLCIRAYQDKVVHCKLLYLCWDHHSLYHRVVVEHIVCSLSFHHHHRPKNTHSKLSTLSTYHQLQSDHTC